MKKLKAADGAAVSEREYERLKALQEGASAKEDVLKKLKDKSGSISEAEIEKKTKPETNAEKKAKRLGELRKEIEGKSKGGEIVMGKGSDYIKDLL